MQLDHVSYAVLNSELGDTVQRLGADLGASFIDGGRHPRFGTRNFILPLAHGAYIEVVAPLDHPSIEQTPFYRAVRQRAESGGGWLGWVLAVDDLAPLEHTIGRSAAQGHRIRPDGVELTWHQIGVLDLLETPALPYFIKWEDQDLHPAQGAQSQVHISEIAICAEQELVESWLGDGAAALLDQININWVKDDEQGVTAVTFSTPLGTVVID
jgi:Glyoxalase-like domain